MLNIDEIYDIAELLTDVFDVNKIKTVNMSGKSIGSGHPDTYELIVYNHSEYKDREFRDDINRLIKSLKEKYPDLIFNKCEKFKTITYSWDNQYSIKIDDLRIDFGRRYYNGRYGKQDGCSHIYYINSTNCTLFESINVIYSTFSRKIYQF